jgi:hypothetical protein
MRKGVKLKNPEGRIWKQFKVYDGNDDEQWEKNRWTSRFQLSKKQLKYA